MLRSEQPISGRRATARAVEMNRAFGDAAVVCLGAVLCVLPGPLRHVHAPDRPHGMVVQRDLLRTDSRIFLAARDPAAVRLARSKRRRSGGLRKGERSREHDNEYQSR